MHGPGLHHTQGRAQCGMSSTHAHRSASSTHAHRSASSTHFHCGASSTHAHAHVHHRLHLLSMVWECEGGQPCSLHVLPASLATQTPEIPPLQLPAPPPVQMPTFTPP
eukprot:361278-Chlamydomonas_euryale.AAC.2